MQGEQLTTGEFRDFIKNPRNFISVVFEYHKEEVLAHMKALGYKVETVLGAKLKIESLLADGNKIGAGACINVAPTFDDMPEQYKDVVFDLINEKLVK